MTSVPRQLATFAAVLLVLFAGGYGVGHLIGDDEDGGHGGHDAPATTAEAGSHGASHNPDNAGHATGVEAEEVRGLESSAAGLRLAVPGEELRPGVRERIAFQILESDGAPLTDYDVVHDKRMHLILVRRDLSGFQHLHPELDESGTWVTTAAFDEPGTYRLFADFAHEGRQLTLGADLTVAGDVTDRPLAEPADVATAGAYEVRKEADGERLSFTVTRDGEEVETEPYLGAAGHLVALRDGDLAYLHVHPEQDELAFEAAFPGAGRYALYLQFRHEGRVQTATFTHEAAG